jgi:hypothetical protein
MKRKIPGRRGYIADQRGIINRYLREEGGWDNHLNRCRKYILESIRRNNPSVVTILGSGWLLDVPIDEIAGKGITTNLVDINHPAQVLKKVSKYSNVNIINDDITGGLIYTISEKGKRMILPEDVPEYVPSYDVGMAISLNLLTQLDMLIFEYLVKLNRGEKELYSNIRKAIQQNHISFLRKQKSVIISDVYELISGEDEQPVTNRLLFADFPEGEYNKSWYWEFDTHGFYYSGKKVIFKVKASEL